jgi:Flp pilus assembly pilin Flp
MDRINSLIVELQTRREPGQAMVEYGLILGLVSVIAIVALTAVGTGVNGIYEAVQAAVEGAAVAP